MDSFSISNCISEKKKSLVIKDTLSYLLFDYLTSLGVKTIFLVPGGGNMFLVDAARRHPEIKCIFTHNEQAAVIAAEGYSRTNNKIGVALVTTGPGATNSITGIAGAWLDSIPLLIISGQVKKSDMNTDKKVRQKGPQEIDIVSMVKGITKTSKTILDPNDFLDQLKKIIKESKSDRPGPCLIDIPMDIQSYEAFIPKNYNDSDDKKNEKIKTSNWCEKIVSCLKKSKRPLFLFGMGAKIGSSQKKIKKIIESTNIPSLFTWPVLDLLPYDHDLYVGRPGVVAKRNSNITLQNCDLLISIGARLDRIVTAFNPQNFAKNAKIFCVDIDINELNKHPERFQKILYDAGDFIDGLNSEITKSKYFNENVDWNKICKSTKKQFGKNIYRKQKKISNYEVIDILSEILPENSIIVTGSSGFCIEVFSTHFINKKNQKVISNSAGLGSMGYGFPALLGAACNSNRELFLYEGDGSAMMNLQELQTLKTNNIKAKIFIINNSGYVSIKNTQKNYFNGRFAGVDKKSGMETSSIADIAKALKIKSYKIKKKSDFKKNVCSTIKNRELIIYEIFVANDEKLVPKCSAFNLGEGRMISAPLEDMSPLLDIKTLRKNVKSLDQLSLQIRKKNFNL